MHCADLHTCALHVPVTPQTAGRLPPDWHQQKLQELDDMRLTLSQIKRVPSAHRLDRSGRSTPEPLATAPIMTDGDTSDEEADASPVWGRDKQQKSAAGSNHADVDDSHGALLGEQLHTQLAVTSNADGNDDRTAAKAVAAACNHSPAGQRYQLRSASKKSPGQQSRGAQHRHGQQLSREGTGHRFLPTETHAPADTLGSSLATDQSAHQESGSPLAGADGSFCADALPVLTPGTHQLISKVFSAGRDAATRPKSSIRCQQASPTFNHVHAAAQKAKWGGKMSTPAASHVTQAEYSKLPAWCTRQISMEELNQAVDAVNQLIESR